MSRDPSVGPPRDGAPVSQQAGEPAGDRHPGRRPGEGAKQYHPGTPERNTMVGALKVLDFRNEPHVTTQNICLGGRNKINYERGTLLIPKPGRVCGPCLGEEGFSLNIRFRIYGVSTGPGPVEY